MKFPWNKNNQYKPERLQKKSVIEESQNYNIVQEPKKIGISLKYFLPKITDEKQKSAAKHIIVFFAVMFILTIAARGIAGASYAVIQTIFPSSDEITEEISANATIRAADSTAVAVPEELAVEKVLVSVGQKIKAGDSLLQVDLKKLQEKLQEVNSELLVKQVEVQELQLPQEEGESATKSAQKEFNRLQEDYQSTKDSLQRAVTQAESDSQAAESNLNEARNKLAQAEDRATQAAAAPLVTEPPLTASGSSTDENAERDLPAVQSEIEDISPFREAVQQAEQAYTQAQQAVVQAREQMQEGLKSAERGIEDAKESLAEAQTADSNRQSQKNIQKQKNQIAIDTANKETQKLKERIKKLQKIADDQGIIKSEQDGEIKTVPTGEAQPDSEAVLEISNLQGRFEAEAQFTKEDAKKLTVGTKVKIFENQDLYDHTASAETNILSLSEPDESNMVTAKVILPEGEWKSGSEVQIKMIESQKRYENCVPLSAIHSNADEKFILIAEQKETILGKENVLVKYPIKILAQNDTQAAIEGTFPWQTPIVLSSTKPIKEGDRVRVENEANEN